MMHLKWIVIRTTPLKFNSMNLVTNLEALLDFRSNIQLLAIIFIDLQVFYQRLIIK